MSKVYSCAVIGLDSEIVEVEADVARGLFHFALVGLPDTAVSEARDRVFAAIKNSGFVFPRQRVTVNLAPADLKKEGPVYDLPIALSLLLATKQLHFNPEGKLFVGELSLDGTMRGVNGVLSVAIKAKREGFLELFVPQENSKEAALIRGMKVYPVTNLKELAEHLAGVSLIPAIPPTSFNLLEEEREGEIDFAYIKGQEYVKRALEIAVAGGHNILLCGPPGAGKTLIARALPFIMPKMSGVEALEVTRIYSVAGLLPPGKFLMMERPFRAPHHTASGVSLVGGGAWPRPGEISLAHRGVLFLDEFTEFSRSVLENLRQPLEDGLITVSRAQGSFTFPAKFTLVAAMNPCPCGYFGDPEKECVCSPGEIARYQKRISGPLLDRIDMHLEVSRVKYDKLASEELGESSAAVRERVEAVRARERQRFLPLWSKKGRRRFPILTNSEMNNELLRRFCALDRTTALFLRMAAEKFHLSARGYFRVLKLSRTIADLAGAEHIKNEHLAEALQYRTKEN